jgi:hypothetical protein
VIELAGYVIAGVTAEPNQITLQLKEPPGKTPIRVRLLEPISNNFPPSAALAGIAIADVVMRRSADGEEAISMELVDGRLLLASCNQIAVDVF